MERLDHALSHDWHVAINKFNDGKHGDNFNHTLYLAKEMADEVPRLALLFKIERTETLPKMHKPCSCCEARPIAKNELTCCLGVKCAGCPMLHALEKATRSPEEIDIMKAWTCATHIATECGPGRHVDTSEGFILTTDDRMYWDGVYASLAAGDELDADEQNTKECGNG